MHYTAKEAVPINLAVSLVTLVVSFITRANALSLSPVISILPVILSLIAGAVAAAFVGTAFFKRLSERRLEQLILFLLIGIGSALIVESFFLKRQRALCLAYFCCKSLGGLCLVLASALSVASSEWREGN